MPKPNQIVRYRGEEIFRTDDTGKPILNEHVTREALAGAICEAVDLLDQKRIDLQHFLDVFRAS